MRSLECPACGCVNQISDRTPGATTRCQRCQKRLVDPSPTSQPAKSSSQRSDRSDRYGVHRLKEPVAPNAAIFGKAWQNQRTSRSFPWRWVGAASVLVIVVTMGVLVFDLGKPTAATRWTLSDRFGFATTVYASSILGLQGFDNKYLVGLDSDTAWQLLRHEQESLHWSRDALDTIFLADLIAKFDDLKAERPQFEFALNAGAAGISDDRVTIVLKIDPKYRHIFSVNASGECTLLENAALVESERHSGARVMVEDGVYRIPVELPWAKDGLRQIDQPIDVHVEIQARFQDGTGHTKQYSIKVHPPNQIEYLYPWGLGFAACVDEDHPWVDYIIAAISNEPQLKAAGVVLAGGGGDSRDARETMYLVWRYLARRGIRYSMITGTDPHHQGVQLFHDAFQDKVANCVDGSVMLASIFGRLGLHCSLVFVPGHCFLGVAVEDDFVFVETTNLGRTFDFQPPEEFLQLFHETVRSDPELSSFLAALIDGERRADDALKRAEAAANHFDARFAAWDQARSPETHQSMVDAAVIVGTHLKIVRIPWARDTLGVDSVGAPSNLPKVPPP
ncbi:MAG: hypothetical protein EXS15_07835 [Phycisphaerales bacterium]|nr:hypothetical protein [Phycisphaerales bacterium]